MMTSPAKIISLAALLCLACAQAPAADGQKEYALWYAAPANNTGSAYDFVVSRGYPYDDGWEHYSLPLGNGYMGVNVFGRTDVERIQVSEKTLATKGPYGGRGNFTSFMEVYLDIFHPSTKGYRRALRLNDAVSTVDYEHGGANYHRECFVNYPDNVIAMKLKADKPGMMNFRVRPVLPYLRPFGTEEGDGRSGKVHAADGLITLSGMMEHFRLPYEGQIRVVNYGGTQRPANDADGDHGTIEIANADSVVIYMAAGTAYELRDSLFLLPPAQKCAGNEHPRRAVSARIASAESKGYDRLKAEHEADYRAYFDRVGFSISDSAPEMPTDKLLCSYKSGNPQPYLEELLFHYGRYLLIASSRVGALPANLQGAWTQYDTSPWSGGYWHNVNVQMNYWMAFPTDMADLFIPFARFNEAYRRDAERRAGEYIKRNNPEAYSDIPGENGWTIGTGSSAYGIEAPGGHSGPGTGGFTTKLFWDYYDFTRDKQVLADHAYPALLGMAKFLSKTLKPQPDGTLLVDPSYSPEQYHIDGHYKTKGCTFDQCMIWENTRDLLEAASILGKKDDFLKVAREEMGRLDPVKIGSSGQLKEYREEDAYGEIGDGKHRHISHLCSVYPGTLVNSNTPEWFEAARVALDMRGDSAAISGWAMMHRVACWARLKNGDKAHHFYRRLLKERTMDNLWTTHPPFQVDANFGATAGVAEMLLQSHEGCIEPLAALPAEWAEGSYEGLVARGNFSVSASWKDGRADSIVVKSRSGEPCRMKYPGAGSATVTDSQGKKVKAKAEGADMVAFRTKAGETYTISVAQAR